MSIYIYPFYLTPGNFTLPLIQHTYTYGITDSDYYNVKCAIEAPHDYLFNLTKKPRLEIAKNVHILLSNIAITKKECMLLTCTCIYKKYTN